MSYMVGLTLTISTLLLSAQVLPKPLLVASCWSTCGLSTHSGMEASSMVHGQKLATGNSSDADHPLGHGEKLHNTWGQKLP